MNDYKSIFRWLIAIMEKSFSSDFPPTQIIALNDIIIHQDGIIYCSSEE
jgi:hypothetical protein